MRVPVLCLLAVWLGRLPAARASRHHHETRQHFRNEWVVWLEGGEHQAQRVADRLGLHNAGPLNGLSNVHLLVKQDHPEASSDAAHHVTDSLTRHPEVLWAEQQFSKQRSKRTPVADYNDPSWDAEWYISRRGSRLRGAAPAVHSGMNLLEVMQQGITGRGVGVVIIDDGVEHNHTDIRHAFDPSLSYDVVDGDRDPSPRYDDIDTNAHGTKCAGIVSMQPNNDFCGVGMATGARLGAVRLLDGVITDRTEGEAFGAACRGADVISVSWGPTDSGYIADMPGRLLQRAIENCVQEGRGGRGVVLVWASGNGGGAADDNCACDGYASSPFTLSVGSVDQDGRMPWYGEICSSTLAVTYTVGHPNNVITTAMHDRCTSGFSGTSASAPMAASMAALVLEVNPELSWRDMQHLVVYTSRPGPVLRANHHWITNAAGLRYNTRVGFGLMDAAALVDAARIWNSSQSTNASRIYCQVPGERSPAWQQLGARGPVTVTFMAQCDDLGGRVRHLEHAELVLSLNYSRRGALSMRLTSPQGTTVTILRPRRKDFSTDGFDGFKLMSVATWGENPVGKWTLEIRDDTLEDNFGEAQQLKLILWGTEVPVHPMTALPPDEMFEEEYADVIESSGAAEVPEHGKVGSAPTDEQLPLDHDVHRLTESVGTEQLSNTGNNPVPEEQLLMKTGPAPEDQPHVNIGRHTEIGDKPITETGDKLRAETGDKPITEIGDKRIPEMGRFTEFVEAPAETSDGFALSGERSKEGSGLFREPQPQPEPQTEPADEAETFALSGQLPYLKLGLFPNPWLVQSGRMRDGEDTEILKSLGKASWRGWRAPGTWRDWKDDGPEAAVDDTSVPEGLMDDLEAMEVGKQYSRTPLDRFDFIREMDEVAQGRTRLPAL